MCYKYLKRNSLIKQTIFYKQIYFTHSQIQKQMADGDEEIGKNDVENKVEKNEQNIQEEEQIDEIRMVFQYAREGDLVSMKKLFTTYPIKSIIHLKDSSQQSLIHLAVYSQNKEMIDFLVKNGSEFNRNNH